MYYMINSYELFEYEAWTFGVFTSPISIFDLATKLEEVEWDTSSLVAGDIKRALDIEYDNLTLFGLGGIIMY